MKMKKLTPFGGALILFALGLVAAPRARAADQVNVVNAQIVRHGTPEAISISTSAYTKVTPTTRLNGITALLIDNPSTNMSTMHGHIWNCTSTSISTSTVKGPIELPPNASTSEVDLDNSECLWLVSRNGAAGAESVMIQPVSQRTGP